MNANHQGHAHGCSTGQRRERALSIALALNGAFVFAEVIGGLVFGSLALLADAAHMGSDVAALLIALVALRLAQRVATARHSYGLRRAEILGAQLNAVILIVVSVWIAVAAYKRASDIPEIHGPGVTTIALVGLAINAASAWVLARAAGENLNMRGAVWHMLSDVLGSIAALASGIAVILWDARWVDVAASFAVAALVVYGALRLLASATRVLLEATPATIDRDEVLAEINRTDGVASAHHLHLWSIDSESIALSVHVVVAGQPTLHDAQDTVAVVRDRLESRFGIDHATVEIECHPCEQIASHQ